MGTFFKDCEHPASRWAKCPHFYKVRYRGPDGNQSRSQARLTSVYNAKKAAPANPAKSERIEKYGQMRFREWTAEAGQRHLAAASLSHLDSLLQHHILKSILLDAHRLGLFDDNLPWASSHLGTTPSVPSSPPLRSSRPCAAPGTTCSGS
ncbi:hypothetical protein HYE82_20870 [Streptomyces sp. BR123]|uniref:hypothetical protein n=1 Tax=Streptomyces sp. BR123 TaxID=2749828 RepID=UPI0015C44E9E|nr:hypothetical protein [Streptomyces sp. BR123]NXY96792.1 hypothetical protein [Streptomyces sp. BR123]